MVPGVKREATCSTLLEVLVCDGGGGGGGLVTIVVAIGGGGGGVSGVAMDGVVG